MSEALFRYFARTHEGEVRTGTVLAKSAQAALLDLKRRSLIVTAVSRTRSSRASGVGFRKQQALRAFYRAFSVMLRSGVNLRRALAVSIARCGDGRLSESLNGILADVEDGSSLSAAMSRRPREFPPLQTAMVAAGEAGGVLDDVLDRIASALDQEHEMRKKIQAALAYPCVVACAAGALVTFLLVRIIPMFTDVFQKFGAPLPLPTRILVQLSGTLRSPLTLLALAAVLLCSAGCFTACEWRFPGFKDRLRLSTPVLGRIFRMATIARITRMLGTLLSSGVGILTTIEAVAPVAGARPFSVALMQMSNSLRSGETLHDSMTRAQLFEPLLLALVAVGEETGAVDRMMLAAAGYLDVEVQTALTTLAAIVEPALIGVLGLFVGLIVFSIFLPLYALIGSIQ